MRLIITSLLLHLVTTCHGQYFTNGMAESLAKYGNKTKEGDTIVWNGLYRVDEIRKDSIFLTEIPSPMNSEPKGIKKLRYLDGSYNLIDFSHADTLSGVFFDWFLCLKQDSSNKQKNIAIKNSFFREIQILGQLPSSYFSTQLDTGKYFAMEKIELTDCSINDLKIMDVLTDSLTISGSDIINLKLLGIKALDINHSASKYSVGLIKRNRTISLHHVTSTTINLLPLDSHLTVEYCNFSSFSVDPILPSRIKSVLNISKSTFSESLAIQLSDGVKYSINDISVLKKFFITDFDSASNTTLLSEIYFKDDALIIINPGTDLTELNPSLDMLGRVRLIFLISGDTREFWEAEQSFEKIRDYILASPSPNTELRSRALMRLDYSKAVFKNNFILKKKGKTIADFAAIIWSGILFLTVNYGYNGEVRFGLTVLVITIIWSIIYHRRYLLEINSFIKGGNRSKNGRIFTNMPAQLFIDYFKCLWFSFVVLVSPKFPREYFLFSHHLLIWLIAEWIVGFFLVILFVVYIASKYPFIHALFGI